MSGRVTPQYAARYVRETIARGLKHEPFSLKHETAELIDGDLVLAFFNGQRFKLTITEIGS